jgi:Cu(I)/Ag(I) efflux system protein CusF
MKRIATTVTALGLALGLAACSQKETTAETAAAPAAAPPSSGIKMAKGTGAVTAVSADSVTIDHGPIPQANWPAMTMAFKASPELTKQVKAGDKVAFDLKLENGGGEITAIKKQ